MTPSRPCLEPTCPEPASYRGRCGAHTTTRNRETRSRNVKVYSSLKWERTRAQQLAEHPLCQCDDPECFEIATDVDHRIPIDQGGDVWAFSNLRSLAHACHSRITRRAQLGKWHG